MVNVHLLMANLINLCKKKKRSINSKVSSAGRRDFLSPLPRFKFQFDSLILGFQFPLRLVGQLLAFRPFHTAVRQCRNASLQVTERQAPRHAMETAKPEKFLR